MNGKAKGLSDRKTTPGQGTRPTLHGQAKDLSDCNTCFISALIFDASSFGPARPRRRRRPRSIQLRAWIADEMGGIGPPAGSRWDEPPLRFEVEERNGN